ncbi:hypothetical protein ACIBQX_04085 [Nonomuraea sp. NPDC049714]|uniref:hypothetical protein n=1 Tax=Nonomuraea sp. NPDC049714 TaxID=3364357 RepID=UPI0037ADB299
MKREIVWRVAASRMISCALALATLTLSACTSTGPTLTGGEPRAGGVAGGDESGETARQSPAPSALTAEAYKGELETRHKTMSGAIRSMVAARTVKTLDQRVARAQEALDGAATELAALVPPPEVKAQHDAYLTSLRDVATDLDSTAAKVGAFDLCTSPAVLTDLGDGLSELDQAGEALEDAGDYPADVVSVKAGKKQTRRLNNGTFLRKGGLGGRSSLQIHNGGTRDAVINVMRGKSKVLSVYVRRKAKFKINSVSDGTYRIYFTSGVDWDRKRGAFSRECSFQRFQNSVKFRTTVTATQIRWTDWRITLHAITGGNARTSKVDPDDFPG